MSREAHNWGESAAADAVRELVVGVAPSVAGKRLLVALQAYIDDSVGEGGNYVLAGHIASADAWEAFSRDWEKTLPMGLRDKDGWYFKMSEMAASPERMERVPAFYRVMEDHILLSVSVHFKIADLAAAQRRIFVPRAPIDWGDFANPHFFAFRGLLDMFHLHREMIEDKIPLDQPVDFIFDDHSAKKPLLQAWDDYLDRRKAHIRKRYGATPIFRDDRQFLPLQAADLWAWWVREWYETGDPIDEHMNVPNFGKWRARQGHRKMVIQFSEDELANGMLSLAAEHLPANLWVCDLGNPGGLVGRRGMALPTR